MDPFSPIIHFLTDSSKGLSSKALLAISIVFILLVTDNVFGFSYHRNIEKKIYQIKEINSILKDSSYSLTVKSKITELQEEILSRKNIMEQTKTFLSKFPWLKIKKSTVSPNLKNPTLHFISSSWFFILIILALPVYAIMEKKTSWDRILITTIITIITIFIFAILWSNILSLIPNIFGLAWINYILNALIQGFILIYFSKVNNK